MAVAVNTTRKAVEISWDTAGDGEPPEPPDGFPEPPDIWGGANEPFPTPPINMPGDEPHPEHPIVNPPEKPDQGPVEPPEGEKPPEGAFPGDPGYKPPVGQPKPPNYPFPVTGDHDVIAVRIFAQGQEGDWSNTAIMPNDGLAVLTYPKDFTGESYVEVRSALDGTVVDAGTIEVK